MKLKSFVAQVRVSKLTVSFAQKLNFIVIK